MSERPPYPPRIGPIPPDYESEWPFPMQPRIDLALDLALDLDLDLGDSDLDEAEVLRRLRGL